MHKKRVEKILPGLTQTPTSPGCYENDRNKTRKNDDVCVKILLMEGGFIQKTGENNLDKLYVKDS